MTEQTTLEVPVPADADVDYDEVDVAFILTRETFDGSGFSNEHELPPADGPVDYQDGEGESE
jgi:hypothetical protein